VSTRRAYAAWVAVCLIWGTTYLGIRIALETIPPFAMAALRWLASGTIIAVFLKARGERLPGLRAWKTLAVLGLLMLGFGNGGVVWAELTVPSGLTAVLVAASPFWMVGVEAFMRGGERPAARQIAGLVVGFGGIVLLVWPELGVTGAGAGGGFLGGVVASQLACLGWAIGSAYSKRHAREDNVLAVVAYEMLFGAAFFFVAAIVHREFTRVTFTPRTKAALVYLILVGGIGGFSSYAYALKHLRVATVSLYAYINPVIAVMLGVLVLNEPFSARMALAAAVVLAGVVLVRQEPTPAS
jgi:drug/metabolite transporter (DMT)-like permease